MSAILGVFGSALPRGDDEVQALLSPMAHRGAESIGIWRDAGAMLAVSRYHWEAGRACSGPVSVVEDGDLVIAADASLYYRDDLRRALPRDRSQPGDDTPSHLILAAYRAWGADALARLEGDFAFILFNRASRTVLCARDFTGRRPLHYAEIDGTLVIASTIGGVRAHPSVPDDLDLTVVAETAAALFAASHETAFRAVRSLRAGWRLLGHVGRIATAPWWQAPPIDASSASSFETGTAELRELLVTAVAERLDDDAPTSVWLSGGWDSPAVFAAGEEFHRRAGTGDALRPVSISYPKRDPGREDELIALVLERSGRKTHWLDIGDIPFLDQPAGAAAARDEPFTHAFEHWNRALARGSRATGATIALDGTGGDLLFASSNLYMADLLRQGRWLELRAEWKAKGFAGHGKRAFLETAVNPLLPAWARRIGTALNPQGSWTGPFDSHVPDWISPAFARSHGLLERAREHAPMAQGRTLADAEFGYYLTHPTGPRLVASYAGFALQEGVEVRSPLYDQRLLAFAAGRPLGERTYRAETKRLLRAACAEWLPAEFLAPRRRRTGGTGRYAGQALRQKHAPLVEAVFRRPLLAELGIVDRDVLHRRWTEFMGGSARYELPLFLTFQTELWLQAHSARMQAEAGRMALACT
jgi:asparagine synthase (glutamine-hydrolysing)